MTDKFTIRDDLTQLPAYGVIIPNPIIHKLKQNIDNTNVPDDWQKLTDQKLLISIYNSMQIVLKSIRVKDYIAAEEIAADISVSLAMLAAEDRTHGM